MKKLLLALVLLVSMVGLVYAGSSGGSAPAVGKVNVPSTVPKPASAECKSLAAGKTGTTYFDVSTTTMVNWSAFASATDSTAVVLKRYLATTTGTNTAYMRGSSSTNEPVSATTYRFVFGKYSSSDNSVTPVVCMDKN